MPRLRKIIRAIKIDVTAQTVTEVHVPCTLNSFYKEIETDIIEAVTLERNRPIEEMVYVDEEGKLRNPRKPSWLFQFRNGQHIKLIGNGLIVGYDPDDGGEERDSQLDPEELRDRIIFLTPEQDAIN